MDGNLAIVGRQSVLNFFERITLESNRTMKHTFLILIMAASAAAAIAQNTTNPAPTTSPAAAPAATAAPAAKPAATAATGAKPAEAKPEAPKHPADVDDEGNPIFHPEAPAKVANIHCGINTPCVIKLPQGIPPTTARLHDSFSLRYQDIKIGAGDEALPGKKYTLHYTGWNAASGIKFDSTYEHHGSLKDKDGKPVMGENGKYKQDPEPMPFTFVEGEGKVIPGLDLGVTGMKVGGKRRIFIPYQLAYGVRGRRGPDAAHPGVTPKSDIIFDVELLEVADPYAHPKPAPKPADTKPATTGTPATTAAPKAAAPAATPATATPASSTAPAASATPAVSTAPAPPQPK
jgi:peptidylprolyl isomerase